MERKTLDQLGIEHKTDKASTTHGYLNTYEKYFESWRDKEFVLLEIGVASGGSFRMWKEYFPNAKVYGIDNNPDCAQEGVFIGSQTDVNFLRDVISKIGAPSIIIDDGGHVGDDQIITFKELFTKVAPNGFFIVEDTHTFYCHTYGGANPNTGRDSNVYKFFSELPLHVDVVGRGMCGNTEVSLNWTNGSIPCPEYSPYLDSMHIHPSLWILKRTSK